MLQLRPLDEPSLPRTRVFPQEPLETWLLLWRLALPAIDQLAS